MKRGVLSSGTLALAMMLHGCAGDVSQSFIKTIANRSAEGRAPFSLDSALRLAETQRKLGDLDGATRTLSQIFIFAPDNPDVLGAYGKTLIAKGQTSDALAFLQRAIELEPGNWSFYSARGVAFAQKHDYPAAQAAFARARTLNPDDPTLLNNMAMSYLEAGNLEGAETLLLDASQGGAKFPQIEKNLALVRQLKQSLPPRGVYPSDATTPVASKQSTPAPADVSPAEVATVPVAVATVPVAVATVPVAVATVPVAVAARPLQVANVAHPTTEENSAALHVQPGEVQAAVQRTPRPDLAPSSADTQKGPTPPVTASRPVATLDRAASPATGVVGGRDEHARSAATADAGGFYIQIGAFARASNVERAISRLTNWAVDASPTTANGVSLQRLRVGPFRSSQQAAAELSNLQALGYGDAWMVLALPKDARTTPAPSLRLSQSMPVRNE